MLDLQYAELKNLSAEEFWMAEMARRSESTKQRYRTFLDKFCKFVGGEEKTRETSSDKIDLSDIGTSGYSFVFGNYTACNFTCSCQKFMFL